VIPGADLINMYFCTKNGEKVHDSWDRFDKYVFSPKNGENFSDSWGFIKTL
jgi:hypothetical protein